MQNKETKKTVLVHKKISNVPYIIVTVILVAIIVCVALLFLRSYKNVNYVTATIGKTPYSLEVADTAAAREKGLSERDSLPANTGMLFVFEKSADWRIWMLQMRFPIDIAWLNDNKQIVHIKHNATPAEYPELYKADQLSRYVIEVSSGAFEAQGVKVGDSISF